MLYMLNTRYWHPAAKTALALVIVLVAGYCCGLYITYGDLVTPCYWLTAMVYVMLAYCVRRMMR